MRRIRVLVVDDSVVVRRIVSDVLAMDPEIELAGVAASGEIALAKIPQLNPDILTLDVEMPGLTGVETLRRLRKLYATLPVIMFSTITGPGAAATIDALTAGADDYVTKPANVGSVSASMEAVRQALIPKIKALATKRLGAKPAVPTAPTARVPSPRPTPAPSSAPRSSFPPKDHVPVLARPSVGEQRVEVLAIGTSTGGPNALAAVISAMPANLPVPLLIVQHMPPTFTRLLAEHLSKKHALPVKEAADGDILRPGQAYIAPGDYHMTVAHGPAGVRIHTHQGPPENSCRPAVDVMFRSVAEVYGRNALAAVLTGMGYDGLRGGERIHEAGGRVLAQDEATSVVWGMAGAVACAGICDAVLPLDQIGPMLVRRVMAGRAGAALPPLPSTSRTPVLT